MMAQLQSAGAGPAAENSADVWPVWVRPVGVGWKFRVRGRTGLKNLQQALEREAFHCSAVTCCGSDEFVFVARTDASRSWDWLKSFLRMHPNFQLMLDPA